MMLPLSLVRFHILDLIAHVRRRFRIGLPEGALDPLQVVANPVRQGVVDDGKERHSELANLMHIIPIIYCLLRLSHPSPSPWDRSGGARQMKWANAYFGG